MYENFKLNYKYSFLTMELKAIKRRCCLITLLSQNTLVCIKRRSSHVIQNFIILHFSVNDFPAK